jgi:hypothetical protein
VNRNRFSVAAGLLVAGVVVIGGHVAAAPPEDDDEDVEELAEAAVEKWLNSQGGSAFYGTIACGVDSVSSHSVYCYAHTATGIIAVSAPIPLTPGDAWQFTMLAGSLGATPTGPIATTTVPSPTAPVPSTTTTTDPGLAPTTTAAATTSFGEGLQLVDVDVLPGRYQTSGSDFCYWERLSEAAESTVEDTDAILANAIVAGPAVVDILDTDVAFSSSGCGTWSPYAPPAAPVDTFGSGTYVVGSDIVAGTYEAEGGPDCYWRRLGGFSADFGELIAIENMTSRGQVVIEETDVGFDSTECGTWTLVSGQPGK